MKITFLGTGTSQGVPVINCHCAVCQSDDNRDHRLRCSVLIEQGDQNIVIDVGPDFRQQMLNHKIDSLSAVVLTHEHNDHIIGMDDLRPFNYFQKKNIPIYGTDKVLTAVGSRFDYAFTESPYPGAPRFELKEIIKYRNFQIGVISLMPLEVFHGNMSVMAFRLGKFAYVTDAKTIPEQTKKALMNLEILVLNALHHREHHSHFNLSQALDIIKELKPKSAYLTHISHWMGKYDQVMLSLPSNVYLAYDSLKLEVL